MGDWGDPGSAHHYGSDLEATYFGKEAVDNTGNYGFTKKLQADCTAAANRIGKSASTIARKMYAKDARVAEFWATHGKRAKSLPVSPAP